MRRHVITIAATLLLAVTGMTGAAFEAAPVAGAGAQRGTCDLLDVEEVQAIQQATIKERKSSDEEQASLRFAQCLFATTDFARSVSLTVISATAAGGDTAVRTFWDRSFHRPPRTSMQPPERARPAKKKEPPRAIAGMGDEAFWAGDTRAGALYVLSNGFVVRVSVGGVTDEEERLRRSRTLAEAALRRLRG